MDEGEAASEWNLEQLRRLREMEGSHT